MTRREALRTIFQGRILRRSLMVGLVVGTILNLINQGDAILSGGAVIAWKLCLTYCVPFLVSSYGAYGALISPVSRDGDTD
ncbi:MAG: nitrate/nitrite transporter NrtS [Sphingobium sp.]|nr:nitrate/nitrite transporter NrtS [Sphingobium sp.]